jgi:limonene-1,2-epoxide hydrolase
MGAKQEAVVSDMLHAWGGDGREPDVEKIMSAFAPDARWTLYMPDGPTIVGKDAIRVELVRQLGYFKLITSRILVIASGDDCVIAERRDHFIRRGLEMEMLLAGTFDLNADNQIVAWRDYFDMLDLAKNSGAEASTMSGLEKAVPTATLDLTPPVPEATAGGKLAMTLQPPLSTEQQFIEDFCDAWGDGTDTSRPDVDKIVSMMAEDAEWQLWVPGGPTIKGREPLRTEILRQMQYATNNKCNTIRSVSNKSVVIQERSDWAVMRGRPCPHQMIAIYELDDEGLIVRWREYINMADLDRKRGVQAAQAHIEAVV